MSEKLKKTKKTKRVNDTEYQSAKKFGNYCFTINNYTDEDIQELHELIEDKWVKYMIAGRETCPTTGTPHIQAYVELKDNIRFSTILNMLPKRAHVEIAGGTAEQNTKYCSKEENVIINFGTPKQQGKRTDLLGIAEKIKEGKSIKKLIEDGDIATQCGLQVTQTLLPYFEQTRNWKPEVIWIHGESGSGKSRLARTIAPNAYDKAVQNDWWQGYDAHEDVLFDDFRDSQINLVEMLRILDRYPHEVNVKNGSRQLLAKRIIVTSIFPPEKMYAHAKGEPQKQLLRRISLTIDIDNFYNAPQHIKDLTKDWDDGEWYKKFIIEDY